MEYHGHVGFIKLVTYTNIMDPVNNVTCATCNVDLVDNKCPQCGTDAQTPVESAPVETAAEPVEPSPEVTL